MEANSFNRKEPKESTLKVYEATLRTILKKLGRSERPKTPLESWAPLTVLQPILDGVKPSTAKVYLSAILYYARKDGSSISYIKSVTAHIHAKMKMVPKKEDKGLMKEDLQPKIDRYIGLYKEYLAKLKDSPSNVNLVFVFYTYPFHDRNFRPLRNDLYTLVIGKQEIGNYYCPKDSIIYLREHKISEWVGDVKIEIPDELNNILVDYIARRNLNDGDKLVSISSSSCISALLRRRSLSTREMRNIFHMYHNGESARQLKDDATNMLHTLGTAVSYYCV